MKAIKQSKKVVRSKGLARGFSRFGTGRDREYLVENLSLLTASGMSIVEALNGIITEMRTQTMKRVTTQIRLDIEAGSPLWKALDHAELFSLQTISLVRIGEESGRLSENLHIVSQQEKKERIFRTRVRSAMMYPIFVMILSLVVGIGIAWFILPRLAKVFTDLKVHLPLVTKLLIGFGAFLGEWGYLAVPVFFALLGITLYVLFFASATKHIGQTFLFSIPAIRDLFLETELARFGYLLGTLLGAGLPVVQAILSLRDATEFPAYRQFYTHLAGKIDEGNSFEKSFASYKNLDRLIPTPVQQLIVSGEQSGKLSEVLIEMSSSYEEKSETTTKDLTVILEPVLLVIIWLGVVGIALAVILPIYSLIGNLNVTP